METQLSRAPPLRSARRADHSRREGTNSNKGTTLNSIIRLAALTVVMLAVFGFLPDQVL